MSKQDVPDERLPGNRTRRSFLLRTLLLCIFAWPLLAWVGARMLVVRAPLNHKADAIVMLSGSEVYRERARYAAQVFKDGRAARVVLTNDSHPGGWSSERQRTMLFVERAQEVLEQAGVPGHAIEIVPQPVSNTHDEAVAIQTYAQARGWRSVDFVTSGYHSRRAWWTIRRVFAGTGKEIGIESVPPGIDTPSPWTWWLHPAGWRMVLGEYLKLVYYRGRY